MDQVMAKEAFVLDEKEDRIIQMLRELGDGEMRVLIADGKPVVVLEERKYVTF